MTFASEEAFQGAHYGGVVKACTGQHCLSVGVLGIVRADSVEEIINRSEIKS